MTDAEIAATEERVAQAEHGPWRAIPAEKSDRCDGIETLCQRPRCNHFRELIVETDGGIYEPNMRTAKFIAHAREDVPRLVAALREAKELLRKAQWQVYDGGAVCPICKGADALGHESDCRLAAAIR